MKVIVVVNIDAKDEEGNKVNDGNVRGHLEWFEDGNFKTISDFAKSANICMDDLCYYDMSEFMDSFNNDEIDMANSFMVYINVKSIV